ncbi:MAG: hypothetical protein K8U57_11270 [Planctomycetes bacterium]|nr:hypothetical protein [Planctomycetota bacterium]
MIYQFYFAADQHTRLFNLPLYRGFGLEPEVNSAIARRCPELATAAARLQLVEFGGMLHLWRNPPDDGHDWIGFTSYRQTDKTPITFDCAREIEHLLGWWDAVAWLPIRFHGSLAEQAECGHPGILAFLERVLVAQGKILPAVLGRLNHGYFASYFLMTKTTFHQLMTWLYPAIAYGLAVQTDPYILSHPKSLGYALERLFMIWYLVERKRVLNYPQYRTFCAADWQTNRPSASPLLPPPNPT